MTTQLIPATIPTAGGSGAAAGGRPGRQAWHRVRATIREMNYATQRIADPVVRRTSR